MARLCHDYPGPPAGVSSYTGSPVMPLLMSVHEVDDALARANRVPDEDRNTMWHTIVDALLDRRVALAGVEANLRDIRVMRAKEIR